MPLLKLYIDILPIRLGEKKFHIFLPFSPQPQFLPMANTSDDVREVGFAKLQGEDFEYYMQTYSIMLGRNSKNSAVDVDLSSLGGGTGVSRHHARIFYDFTRRRFAMEVLGRNGCIVEGVLHLPGGPPVKLDSQDLLRIGDKEFYFLLPSKSVTFHPMRYPLAMAAAGGQADGVEDLHGLGAAARKFYREKKENDESGDSATVAGERADGAEDPQGLGDTVCKFSCEGKENDESGESGAL